MNICAYNGHGGVIPTRLCKKRQATSRCLPSIVNLSYLIRLLTRNVLCSAPQAVPGHVAHLLRRSRASAEFVVPLRAAAARSAVPCFACLTYALTRRCRYACRLISSPRLSMRSRRRCGGCRRKSSRLRDGRASSCPRRARERSRRKRPRCPL